MTTLQRQGDEDAVIHGWPRPASGLQVLTVLQDR